MLGRPADDPVTPAQSPAEDTHRGEDYATIFDGSSVARTTSRCDPLDNSYNVSFR
jgi:hypothetical protein